MSQENIFRVGERQGTIFQSSTGWHWVVTSGRMAGRGDVAHSKKEATTELRNTWKKGRRINLRDRQLVG